LQQVAYDIPEGIEVDDRIVVKGTVGEAIVQLESALDLVTWEIANNLKERKVLVVWMLDASGSLAGQRKLVKKRLKRIYGELEALERIGQLPMRDQPLLSAVVSYGLKTTYLTKSPTDQFSEIEKAFAALKPDESGKENVFTAFYQVMGMWGHYRNKQGRQIMPILRVDYRITPRTEFKAGAQGFPFCRESVTNHASPESESTRLTYTALIQNKGNYLGYDLVLLMGTYRTTTRFTGSDRPKDGFLEYFFRAYIG